MKKLLEFMEKMGEGITKDIESGKFGSANYKDVPWLQEEPKTPKEIAVNLAQRLEAGGFSLQFSPKSIDRESLGGFLSGLKADSVQE